MAVAKKLSKDLIKESEKLLKEIMKLLELDAETSVEMNSYENREGETEDFVNIKVDGDDLGVLIGYMGKNLRAFQKVFTMLLNKRLGDKLEEDDYIRVVVDAADYRDSRKNSLEAMAKRIREEVLESGEEADLPPMTAFERRVIHLCLQEFDDVESESFGEGRERHVRIKAKA